MQKLDTLSITFESFADWLFIYDCIQQYLYLELNFYTLFGVKTKFVLKTYQWPMLQQETIFFINTRIADYEFARKTYNAL